jgi:hypothetical protein
MRTWVPPAPWQKIKKKRKRKNCTLFVQLNMGNNEK